MSWDITTPPDTESIRNGASRIREEKIDLTTALSTEGIFPGPAPTTPIFRYAPPRGTTAARPAAIATDVGRLYINTDTGTLQRCNGTGWDDITPATSIIPSGMIMPFGANIGAVPQGYLYCNGQAVSRTTYATLFAVVGTSWGSGDGSTTFNVPDLRGAYLRGRNDGASDSYSDPDSASRTNRLTGGATGDNTGSFQNDRMALHTHSINQVINTVGAGATGVSTVTPPTGTQTETGSETRGRNASVAYVIKT